MDAAAPLPHRWPPWRAYGDAVSHLGGAPVVRFEECGASSRAFIGHLFVSVHWAHGRVRPRALRRREVDVSVACDCEEAPKRVSAVSCEQHEQTHVQTAPTSSDALGALQPPAGAMVLSRCEYHFFPLRSGAAAVVLFKRAVPRSTRSTMTGMRRAGNAATLVLAAIAPLRFAVRRLSKPRTVAVAVLPLATLREAARRGEDTGRLRTLLLDLLAVPPPWQLSSTDDLLNLFEQHCAEPGEELAATPTRGACATLSDALRRLACGQSGVDGDQFSRTLAKIGRVCVSVSLDFARGTTDDGRYNGPPQMVVLSAGRVRHARGYRNAPMEKAALASACSRCRHVSGPNSRWLARVSAK